MAYRLPQKLQNLTPYTPISGTYPIRMDANESFLELPDQMLSEILDHIKTLSFRQYPDPYCSELCVKFATFYGVNPEQVVAGNGSDELIGLIIHWFTEPEGSLLTICPDFSMYSFYAQASGRQVEVLENPDFQLDVALLIDRAKKSQSKLLIFSNPCNPTAQKISREQIVQILLALPDVLVVVDEAYMDFSNDSVLDLTTEYDNLLVLKTCSKAFGLAGIRLGFAVGAPYLIAALKAAKSPYNVNAMTQAVGCVLFSHPDYLKSCIKQITDSRDHLFQQLQMLTQKRVGQLEVLNTHANFVFLQVQNPTNIFSALIEQGIVVRCMQKGVRVSAGTTEENERFLRAFSRILDEEARG